MATRSWLVTAPSTETVPARPSLRVQLVAGAVEVVGDEGEDIRLEFSEVSGNPVEVVLEDTRVSVGYPSIGWEGWVKRLTSFRSSDTCRLRIRLPRATAVSVATAAAEIHVSGVEADLRLNSASGTIYTSGVKGKVTARTFSGPITLDQQEGPVTAQSAAGAIAVQGAVAHLGVSTGSGGVRLRNAAPASVVTVSALSGAVDVTLPRTGLVLTARSVSGAVDVDGASRRTSSGPAVVSVDERGDAAACWLTVNTVSGALSVQRVG